MSKIQNLIKEVNFARQSYLGKVNQLTEQQAQWKPSPEVWNVVEITEHLFWAEQGGILSIWKALQASREGRSIWEGERIHAGKTMESIIAETWKEKEIVPLVAAPRLGGPIAYWKAMLQSLVDILQDLETELSDEDLSIMTPPHPISGPFDIQQRLEFLAFHIYRHLRQVTALHQDIL
jgi:DinB superfamily